jgi:hypothetical protein
LIKNKITKFLLGREPRKTEVEIRGEAWFSFEKMVIKRIKKNYPKQAEEMINTLLA